MPPANVYSVLQVSAYIKSLFVVETKWREGTHLLTVYAIVALAFLFVPV